MEYQILYYIFFLRLKHVRCVKFLYKSNINLPDVVQCTYGGYILCRENVAPKGIGFLFRTNVIVYLFSYFKTTEISAKINVN
jgi:hypothetical protein